MTQQEIFETVARHLFNQGERAFDFSGQCAYRGEQGLACAVGCLISDADYDADYMEGLDVYGLVESGQLPSNLVPHVAMLNRLQILHDSDAAWRSTEAMRRELNEIGWAFVLNNDFLASLAFSDDAKRLNLQ